MFKYTLLIVLLTIAFTQNTLEIDKKVKIVLIPNTPTNYTAMLSQQSTQDQGYLFILADPLVASPTQIPSIQVTLANGSQVSCFTDTDLLEGICRLNSSQLGSSVLLSMKCAEECSFWLKLYLDKVYPLEVDHTVTLAQNTGELQIYEFGLEVPARNFDQLTIYLGFDQRAVNDKGAEMYANVGNWGALQPDQQKYQYKAKPVVNGIVLDLPKDDIPAGTWVKISIFSEFQGDMMLSTLLNSGNSFTLSIQQPNYVVIPHGKLNTFNISLVDYYQNLDDKDINIQILLYSGYPEIAASFLPDFNVRLENYGQGGNLNYLITPQMRQAFNFSGFIYIQAQAFSEQVSFKLTATVTSSAYIYMEEGISYVAVIENREVQNYIYDFQYIALKNVSSDFLVFFTVKAHLITGSVYYYSRICNKTSNDECLVDVKGLQATQFIQDTQTFKGDILHYSSIYQIYQWTPLNRCQKQSYNTTADRYRCKIHIVAQNPHKSVCEWIMTIFSRQNNIQLTPTKPFKDKVIEQSYNYYYFIPPTIAYQQITIFLTMLTGEAQILTSQLFQRPEFILQQWDKKMKVSVRNEITYRKDELSTAPIYIGVYGDSMAEYMIHVVVEKNQTTSFITLLPEIGQLFRLETDQSQMKFKLRAVSSGEWTVQVNPINDYLAFQVEQFRTQNATTLCKSNYLSTCVVGVKQSGDLSLTVSRSNSSSKRQIRFVAAYYPRNSCRMLPLGTPSLMSIPFNSTSCIYYILDGREVVLAYSRNLLSSLMATVTLEVSINNKTLGTLQTHYKLITADIIKQLCPNRTSQNTRCVLKVSIRGSAQAPVDLWLTAALTQASIPLFSGVVLPFSRKSTSQDTPLRFYYQPTQSERLTLLVHSYSYDSYAIQWTWIDEVAYLSADTDDQIYPALGQGKGQTQYLTRQHRSVAISIDPQNNCTNCILLVSIIPKDSISLSQLQLQIIGSSSPLNLGETKKGILRKEQSMVYSISAQATQSVISFSNYDRMPCYNITIIQASKNNKQQNLNIREVILQANNPYEVQLVGNREACNFQLSYWKSDSPIRSMWGGHTYYAKLQNSSTLYFVYKHTLNSSFRIYQIITSGSLYGFATPLVNTTLAAVMKSQKFLFGSDTPYEDLYVDKEDQGFCFDCNYLIKLIGEPSAEVQVGISDSLTPVVLPAGGVVREKIIASSYRVYEYYTTSDFKIRMTIVRGSVKLRIMQNSQKPLISQLLTKDSQIAIVNSDNRYNIFKILLETEETTVYALQIEQDKSTGTRLIEGMPFSYNFKQEISAQFIYSHAIKDKVYLTVIVEERNETVLPNVKLEVSEIVAGTQDQKEVEISPGSRSGNMVIFIFKGEPADYKLSLTLSTSESAKILITRHQLTYLPPDIQLLNFQPSIFQIDTKGNPVMLEVFACQGQIELQATEQYSFIQSDSTNQPQQNSVVILEQNNIAGHYVVNSQSVSPQFYAKVRGDIYRLRYSYIQDEIPYKYFTAVNYNMNFDMTTQKITLKIQIPLPRMNLQKQFGDVKASYDLIYGKNYQYVKRYTQCKTGGTILVTSGEILDYPYFQGEFNLDVNRHGALQTFAGTLNEVAIGCQITLKYRQNITKTRVLQYIYEPLVINLKEIKPQLQEIKYSQVQDILIIVLVVFVVLVLLYVAIGFCWHYWRVFREHKGYVLQEEDQTNNPSLNAMSKVREEVTEKA